jgi:hypothetical protein
MVRKKHTKRANKSKTDTKINFNCSKRPTAEECMEHRWLLPTDHLVKKRERAVFLGNRLKVRCKTSSKSAKTKPYAKLYQIQDQKISPF